MNAVTKAENAAVTEAEETKSVNSWVSKKTGLEYLLEPVDPKLISQLPKPTKQQTEALKANHTTGIRCPKCGGWHHKDVQHLDYVGHAAVTRILLTADPHWSWQPTDFGGLKAGELDANGGMWIALTVCGVTRLGYGDAGGKTGADAMKERIGDAIRNAAMRFGVALSLWSKADLDSVEFEDIEPSATEQAVWLPKSKEPESVPANGSNAEQPAKTSEPEAKKTAPSKKAESSEQKKQESAPPAEEQSQAPIDNTIVSAGEAMFLRNKIKDSGKTEAQLCELFSVNGGSFDGATKSQWLSIKKELTGK